MKFTKTISAVVLWTVAGFAFAQGQQSPRCFSGIYPSLAYYNSQGECGTGAVVPWQGSLWVVTYSPDEPFGSDDRLYQITPDLKLITRPESIGGTPANRMIHLPSNQLFIGPYVIDSLCNVRVLPWQTVPGRHTGNAAHLQDPENRILLATMESGFYDLDVHTLEAVELYKDGHQKKREGFKGELCTIFPGYHGKGFYSGQGVAVYSNNGEEGPLAQKKFDIPSGSLNEWDGEKWTLVRRNQFTEVTGPGGIYGNPDPANDPIWSLGWDYKSVILAIREPDKGWSYYRLPKASFAYDGAHGWNTEWPRIRNVGTEGQTELLMTMHGMFWHFPESFSTSNSSGIRPRGAYLKVIGDFTEWNGRLVFGCDDSAKSEFLNKRPQKGGIAGPGRSNSNLWFCYPDTPDKLGPTTASGSVWMKETVKAGEPSEPFIFQGWDHKCAWLANRSKEAARISFEVDEKGNGMWKPLKSVDIAGESSLFISFEDSESGAWVRAVSDKDICADLEFNFTQKERRSRKASAEFKGLSKIGSDGSVHGLMYGLPDKRVSLGFLVDPEGESRYYELDKDMKLSPVDDPGTAKHIKEHYAVPENVISIEAGSVLVVDAKGRRWRLPLGDPRYSEAKLRVCREVVTERDLFSCQGTFFELPAENADGFAKLRPVCSHNFRIYDYASFRGMMMLSGVDVSKAAGNSHIVKSEDGRAALWAGVIEDLWKMGKPVGHGGPWVKEKVNGGVASDPFLIGFYDKRSLTLSNHGSEPVEFILEVDPTGDGQWFEYKRIGIGAGRKAKHSFPASFQARWIRIVPDKDTEATADFIYK